LIEAMTLNPIDDLFGQLRLAKAKAFIPFIAACDPSSAGTIDLIRDLDAIGCHLIEVGFPFSDPIADGPVIQASYTRALDRGVKVDDVMSCVEKARPVSAPLVGMASYTLVFRRGPEKFVERAKAAGFSGLIVPDLPAEEAEDFARLCKDRAFCNIMLVTPTTPPARAEKIVRLSTGFVYCVSIAGITGERDRLPDELLVQLKQLRCMTSLPLCVGFGVGKPEQVRTLREIADGVIVGSAIVRRLEKAGPANWDAVRAEILWRASTTRAVRRVAVLCSLTERKFVAVRGAVGRS
jgi:tryptophan synthase alpha chain